MKVSIIIPVYNAERFLEETILSAIKQTYQDTEIIAVYDGYPDRSMEILKKYSNKIKIVTKESGNAASALNAGIRASCGEWIKRLDADDVLNPEAVEELITESKNLKDKKHTVLYSNYDIIDSKGNLVCHQIEPNYNEFEKFDFNVMLLDHHIGLASTSLVHKSTIENYGMFDESISFEDYELWLRYCILHNCRLYLVPKILTKYRIHGSQITKAKAKNSLEKTENIRKNVLEKLEAKEREKYSIALKKYKKEKSMLEKGKFFVRYNLFPILPKSFSKQLTNLYWYSRNKK